jgi:hypothetical protein
MTSFTCSSRHARTQRVHWMQASRFTDIAGWDASAAGWERDAKRERVTPSSPAQWKSSLAPGLRSTFGTSAINSSTTIFCECSARCEVLSTSMPFAGERQHEGASTRSPLISTMHARQLPSGR